MAADKQDDPVVGHKTFAVEGGGYRHEPLRRSEADALLAEADAAKAKRAADMPTELDAARALWSAYQRLKELGWRETCYGPTGVTVQLIVPGSSGIHQGFRHEPWPEKTWWIDGDWPSNPCLFKPLDDSGVTASPSETESPMPRAAMRRIRATPKPPGRSKCRHYKAVHPIDLAPGWLRCPDCGREWHAANPYDTRTPAERAK